MTNSILILIQLSIQRIPFWPFLLMLGVVATIFYIRSLNLNGWKLMVRSAFSNKAVYQLIREDKVMENTNSGILALTFFFSIALFFYNINETRSFGLSNPSFLRYFIIFMFIISIYVVKILALYLLQLVFDAKKIFDTYIIGLMNVNILLGIILIPLNLLMIYNTKFNQEVMIFIALFFLGLSFILRLIKGFDIGMNNTVKWKYIILYLCTLEIMPIVILIETLDDFSVKIF